MSWSLLLSYSSKSSRFRPLTGRLVLSVTTASIWTSSAVILIVSLAWSLPPSWGLVACAEAFPAGTEAINTSTTRNATDRFAFIVLSRKKSAIPIGLAGTRGEYIGQLPSYSPLSGWPFWHRLVEPSPAYQNA